MVNGIVIVGKYHHCGDTVNVDLPLLSVAVLKKTMLKIAWEAISQNLFPLRKILHLTEMKVPGRKTIVTAAMVIIDELSRFASQEILEVSSAICRFVRLSTCEAMLNKRFIISLVRSL